MIALNRSHQIIFVSVFSVTVMVAIGATVRIPPITTTIQPDLDAWSQSPAQMTPQTVQNSGDE